jgi:hypothetical protein
MCHSASGLDPLSRPPRAFASSGTQPRRNEESALVVGDFIGFALRIHIRSEFGVHPAFKPQGCRCRAAAKSVTILLAVLGRRSALAKRTAPRTMIGFNQGA